MNYAELKKGDEIRFEGRKGVLLSDAVYKATASKGWFEARVRWADGREESFILNRVNLNKLKMNKLSYGTKVLAVQKAMREGKEFHVETYLGSLKVESIDHDGSWAVTGHDFSQRSWAICSTDIDRWFAQIKETQ